MASNVLRLFHPPVADWFASAFDGADPPPATGLAGDRPGESTLILAPTGTGKTLTAFLCLPRSADVRAGAGARRALPRPVLSRR